MTQLQIMSNKKKVETLPCPECKKPLFWGHYYDKGNGKKYPACYHCYAKMLKYFTQEDWDKER